MTFSPQLIETTAQAIFEEDSTRFGYKSLTWETSALNREAYYRRAWYRLHDASAGEKHCIHCHEQGHHYSAHFGLWGLEPRIDPFSSRVVAGPCETNI